MATIAAAYGVSVPGRADRLAHVHRVARLRALMDLQAFLADCAAVLGPRHVLTDPDVTAAHGRDWTGRWSHPTTAVVRPASTVEVAAVVASARRCGIALVPQGGNTGLVGGSVPHDAEVVVDLRRLDHVGAVDVTTAQVSVGAGATLASVNAAAAGVGLMLGVDLAAREQATIGGMIATNAGGTHVLRYGTMRAQVLGIEAVLGSGDVVAANLAGLVKDNTGYDLPGLLCGSEGTLGIVTTARLRLVERPTERIVALVGFDSLDAAVRAVPVLRAQRHLHAVELMLAEGMAVVARHLGATPPLDPMPPCLLLVELAGSGSASLRNALGAVLEGLDTTVVDSAVAEDERTCGALWRWREAHSAAAAALGLVHKADVTVPVGAVPRFVPAVQAAAHDLGPGLTVLLYGHLGDGNVHVNVVGALEVAERVLDAVLELALEVGGSVSAEHGIGVAKRSWLERQRGAAAVEAMRAIKRALDPDNVLNPAVLLPRAH